MGNVLAKESGGRMKYFLVSTEANNNPMPQITDWHEQINPRDITLERAGNIPQWVRLSINNGADAVFSDILSVPGYLVSSMVRGVMKLYDPYIQYRQMVLFNKRERVMELYHLPILPVRDCLLPESELSRDKSKIIRGVIGLEEKKQCRPIIKLGGVAATHIAFRLDIVESILRRGAKGLKLVELEVKVPGITV